MKKHSGFTLIELMVVMAIIAILATAGLTAYTTYVQKARDSARLQIAMQIMTKVEVWMENGPAPTPAELNAFLAAEGFAYSLPKMNPVIAHVGGMIDTVFGTIFALPELDPMNGAGVCLGHTSITYSPCGFGYTTYSDGSYTLSYGIEHSDNKNNFWQMSGPSPTPSGNILGNNQYIIPANASAPASDAFNANMYLAENTTITLVEGGYLSDISEYETTQP